jgi:tetratricopeptide (TPR) repeat protein
LPFLGNSKERGIKEVRIAMEKGTYVDIEATSSLVRIHFVEKRYREAIETAKTILKDFPDYLYCYWYIADSYIKLEDYTNAIKTLEWIKVYFEGSDLDGSIALLEVKYKLGRIYYKMDEYQKALEYLEKTANGRSDALEGFANINKYPALAEKLIKKIMKKQ